MMYYVYILLSDKDGRFYIGSTSAIARRFQAHGDGMTPSTRARRPLRLLFYEAHQNKLDALRRERYFKSTKGKTTETLRQMLQHALQEAGTHPPVQ